MSKIMITIELFDEYSDPGHEMGVTEEAYIELQDVLSSYGDDIEIQREGHELS